MKYPYSCCGAICNSKSHGWQLMCWKESAHLFQREFCYRRWSLKYYEWNIYQTMASDQTFLINTKAQYCFSHSNVFHKSPLWETRLQRPSVVLPCIIHRVAKKLARIIANSALTRVTKNSCRTRTWGLIQSCSSPGLSRKYAACVSDMLFMLWTKTGTVPICNRRDKMGSCEDLLFIISTFKFICF